LKTLPGLVPSRHPRDACGFLNRCALASEACRTAIPLRAGRKGDHLYRCRVDAE
jgi:ABC-type dipeptide/oligopeptide/nickel transport system ATPase component